MKKLLFTMIVVACTAMAQTPTTNAVSGLITDAVVVQPRSIRVELTSITIRTSPMDKKIIVSVQWRWLDASGKSVRSGMTMYKEDDLKTKLEAIGVNIDDLKNAFKAIAAAEAAS